MTWLYGGLGLLVGLVIGYVLHAYVARAIEAENGELREYLRYLRDAVDEQIPRTRRELARQIDRLLGDEAA